MTRRVISSISGGIINYLDLFLADKERLLTNVNNSSHDAEQRLLLSYGTVGDLAVPMSYYILNVHLAEMYYATQRYY